MRKLLLAGAAILAFGAAANAEEFAVPPGGGACVDWPAAMVATQSSHPDALLVKVLKGALAHEFIGVVNQLPPASDFDGDQAALFFTKSDEQFVVVIGKGDCARHVVELPASIFARMVGQPV